MLRQRRLSRALAALSVLALLATACTNGDDGGADSEDESAAGEDGDGEAADGGEFSTHICEPESLTPPDSNETCGSQVLEALFSGLVEYDVEDAEPLWGDDSDDAIAESIESDDNVTWTITLKDGWTFHDGSNVTAESFVNAWNYGALGENAQANNYFFDVIEGYEDLNPEEGEAESEELSGLEVVDDTTFEVTLTAPYSNFPQRLGYNPFFPLPDSFFDDPDAFNEAPVGTGPYQMDGEWDHDVEITTTRYEDYGGEPGKAEAITFAIYAEIETAYRDVQAGQLDIVDDIPSEHLAGVEDEFGDRYVERESSSFTYIGFPLYDERFQSQELRQAFSQAIDREAIVEAIFEGTNSPADALVSPVVNGYREGACGELCEYDPDAAAEKLEEAGGFDDTLTLWFNSGADHDQWMEAVANQLRDNLGIEDIEFESLDFAEYLELADNEELTGPFRLGWVMDYPSPENYLAPIHGSNGSSNNTGYSNEEVDELIQQGNEAESLEEGIEFYNEAEDIILEEMPVIPMFFGMSQGAHSERVSNVQFDSSSLIDVKNVTVEE